MAVFDPGIPWWKEVTDSGKLIPDLTSMLWHLCALTHLQSHTHIPCNFHNLYVRVILTICM